MKYQETKSKKSPTPNPTAAGPPHKAITPSSPRTGAKKTSAAKLLRVFFAPVISHPAPRTRKPETKCQESKPLYRQTLYFLLEIETEEWNLE